MPSKILIADDVPEIRRLLKRMFRDCDDFEVVAEAVDGDEAVDRCRELEPDVIFLDINMPKRTGLQALRDIRQAIPDGIIVVFTGLAEPVIGDETFRSQVDAWIEKGAHPHDIVEEVRKLVNERSR